MEQSIAYLVPFCDFVPVFVGLVSDFVLKCHLQGRIWDFLEGGQISKKLSNILTTFFFF